MFFIRVIWIRARITSESDAIGNPKSSLPVIVNNPFEVSYSIVFTSDGARSLSSAIGNSARFISSRPTFRVISSRW